MASNETEGLRALRQFAQKKMQLDCGESDDRRLSEWMQILSEWTFTNASARDLVFLHAAAWHSAHSFCSAYFACSCS